MTLFKKELENSTCSGASIVLHVASAMVGVGTALDITRENDIAQDGRYNLQVLCEIALESCSREGLLPPEP